jgi:ABC-type dipeptide/oligopeptide/nickel transport system permease subunit
MVKRTFLRRMAKSKFFKIGFFSIIIIASLCLILPLFVKYNPLAVNLVKRLKPPEWFSGHFFGTDALGRDILARLLKGGGTSLIITFTVVLITTVFGLTLGLIAGYFSGIPDLVLMRICDVMSALPTLLLAICVVAVLGGSFTNLIIVLSLTSWIMVARVVRSRILTIRTAEYISAAKVIGMPDITIILREVLPNVITPVIISATQAFGGIILTEASMSYLGLGIPPPNPSWGNMISDGREYIDSSPWVVIVPGIALMLTVLAVNFLGDGLRDVFDPKNRD